MSPYRKRLPFVSIGSSAVLVLALAAGTGCIGKRRPQANKQRPRTEAQADADKQPAAPAPEAVAAAAVEAAAAPPPAGDPNHKAGEASRVPNYAVPTGRGRPQKGSDDALVTIVQYSAFDCDACKKTSAELDKILAKWKGDVRIVFRHAPSREAGSQELARAAAAAHSVGKFWDVHDKLVQAASPSAGDVAGLVTAAGGDASRYQAALTDGSSATIVQEDLTVLDKFRGQAQAPILFVNGRYLDGAPSFAEIDALVGEEKGKVETFMREQGVARGPGLYEQLRQRGADGKPWRGYQQLEDAIAAGAAAPARGEAVKGDLAGLPVKGDPSKAKVTLLECSDFDCPFCKRGQETIAQVAEEYGDKVAIYFRQNPLPMHPNAESAHRAALAAHRQGKFWPMHDKLFDNTAARSTDQYEAYAKEIGLDVAKWRKDFDDPAIAQAIKDDLAACQQLGVTGVPAFFINGESLIGAQPFDEFKKKIDAALAG